MRFVYTNRHGITKEHALINWSESGLYIKGATPSGDTKTYLKYRVDEYLDNSDKLLTNPYPSPAEINAHFAPTKTPKTNPINSAPQICFTGFPSVQKSHLESKAKQHHMHVVTDVTVNLKFLVAGPTRGPAKIAKAMAKGVMILLEDEFHRLLDTGELPDGEDDLF